ncbi:MAG: TCR/Tet family MFS transporter [Crocinitomicaceae bacterium]|nr:TCR/Tet family MFS transporter [Crocinitomicaceae bacterium]MBP6032743.1 TCR/Tet family MFS transporter [Crocinitomicaceae bacterium]
MNVINPKSALIFILVTICLDSIGLGIIIPSFPTLISETAHVPISQASQYFGWVMGAYAFMQFIFSPLIGNLSDRFGRRPILLISVLGMSLDYLVMYFAPDLWWLVIGRAVSGIFGASFTSASAYIADISTPDKRAQNFGMIGAAFGIGFVIGPAIGGLLSDFGARTPFLVAAFFSMANFIYGFIVLKESLPVENRRTFEWKRSNPFGALKQIKRFEKLKYLFLVSFLTILTTMCVHSTWNFYSMEKFGWTTKEVGISLAVVGVCFGVVQGALTGKIVAKMGQRNAAKLGLFLSIFVLMGMGLIYEGWMMYAIILPYAFTGIVDPAIRSIISGQVQSNEQGELQGIFTSLMSLAEIIGPPLFMWFYYNFKSSVPNSNLGLGTPFLVAAFIALLAFFLISWTLKGYTKTDEVVDEE